LGTEGGHTSFAPRDEREIDILRHAWSSSGMFRSSAWCPAPGWN
jgi:glucokinase